MGVESIELDTVNLRMVARTLPGKQFEVGRRIRVLMVRALRRAGISVHGNAPMVAAIPHAVGGSADEEAETQPRRSRNNDLLVQGEARPPLRVSCCGLIAVFMRLFSVQQSFQPEPAPEALFPPSPARFMPDPNYTCVPAHAGPAAEGGGHTPRPPHRRPRPRHHAGAGRHHRPARTSPSPPRGSRSRRPWRPPTTARR